jgi:hypothetical protein
LGEFAMRFSKRTAATRRRPKTDFVFCTVRRLCSVQNAGSEMLAATTLRVLKFSAIVPAQLEAIGY